MGREKGRERPRRVGGGKIRKSNGGGDAETLRYLDIACRMQADTWTIFYMWMTVRLGAVQSMAGTRGSFERQLMHVETYND